MLDLVSQIRSWRENLAAEAVYGPADLDELEIHLREELASLTGQGLSEQEAFAVACLRLGDSKRLSPEFAKVNTDLVFKKRLFWMCAGVLGYGLITKLAALLSGGTILAGASAGLTGNTLGVLAESVHVLTLALAVLGLLFVVRRCTEPLAFPAWVQSTRGKLALFAGLAALSLVLMAAPVVLTAVYVRMLIPRDIVPVVSWVQIINLFWPMAGSLVLIGWVVKMSCSMAAKSRS